MSDPAQHRAVRLQSSAIVFAALITTAGAITSAFIQNVSSSKSDPAPEVSPRGASPAAGTTVLAAFTGYIEPLSDSPRAAPSTAALSPAVNAAKPLYVPSQRSTPKTQQSKLFDWSTVSRFFQGHD